jgi:hypothetical protein
METSNTITLFNFETISKVITFRKRSNIYTNNFEFSDNFETFKGNEMLANLKNTNNLLHRAILG